MSATGDEGSISLQVDAETEIRTFTSNPIAIPPRSEEGALSPSQTANREALSPKEKGQKMQELMTGKFSIRRPASRNSDISRSNSSFTSTNSNAEDDPELASLLITDEDRVATFFGKEVIDAEKHFGCSHYKTNCKMRGECCGNWYTCRFCHDEKEDHPFDRYSVKYIICLHCQTPQHSSQTCKSCKRTLANYFCGICSLWDDDLTKEIYHCEKCRICRRGNREDFIHCERCSGCISADHYPGHKCLDGSLQSSCPICGENLFATTTPVLFMPCGHAIHFLCHQDHTKNSYQCPICLKSLSNMRHFFERIDEMMASQQMPEEYSKVKSFILCNDCEQKSSAKFHFVYHRCAHCSSYNTKLLRTFNEDDNSIESSPLPRLNTSETGEEETTSSSSLSSPLENDQ